MKWNLPSECSQHSGVANAMGNKSLSLCQDNIRSF